MALTRGELYVSIIERVFFEHYIPGMRDFYFLRGELDDAADAMGIQRAGNKGDLLYAFRFRTSLPQSIRGTAPDETPWVIRLAGRGRYRFQATALANITPALGRAETKLPDATPGIIARYALDDEQALLAKLRYNRLIDVFTGVTCYSLQNHLRTYVSEIGQTETDEVYVGVDSRGVHYVFPVEAKGGKDKLSIVQVEQDYAMCSAKFPSMVCRPVAAQFMEDDVIAMFQFEAQGTELPIVSERHYRLVPKDQLSDEDLAAYRLRTDAD